MKRPPGRHNIRRELWPLARPIDSMAPNPDNPSNGDDDVVAESLRVNGQYRAVIVWDALDDGTPLDPPLLLAGHTTQRAALAEGWTMLAAESFVGSSEEATRVLLVDNGSARKARMDPALELDLVRSLESLEGTSYVDADVARLAARVDAPLRFPDEGVRPVPGPSGSRECSQCGHRCLTVHT